jgi:hypothetical protein
MADRFCSKQIPTNPIEEAEVAEKTSVTIDAGTLMKIADRDVLEAVAIANLSKSLVTSSKCLESRWDVHTE